MPKAMKGAYKSNKPAADQPPGKSLPKKPKRKGKKGGKK